MRPGFDWGTSCQCSTLMHSGAENGWLMLWLACLTDLQIRHCTSECHALFHLRQVGGYEHNLMGKHAHLEHSIPLLLYDTGSVTLLFPRRPDQFCLSLVLQVVKLVQHERSFLTCGSERAQTVSRISNRKQPQHRHQQRAKDGDNSGRLGGKLSGSRVPSGVSTRPSVPGGQTIPAVRQGESVAP